MFQRKRYRYLKYFLRRLHNLLVYVLLACVDKVALSFELTAKNNSFSKSKPTFVTATFSFTDLNLLYFSDVETFYKMFYNSSALVYNILRVV